MSTMAPSLTPSGTRRFSADEVWRMVTIGLLEPDEPYELLDGELVDVSPQNPAHAGTIQRLNALLVGAYGDRAIVRPQLPVGGIADSIPEPDLAVGPATLDELERHPRADELWLVIEICDSSRAGDGQKSAIYARAGAPRHWIIDVNARSADVCSRPRPDGTWTARTLVAFDQPLGLPELNDRRPILSEVLRSQRT